MAGALEPGKPFKDPFTGMQFVFIKGGCYEMGDTFGDGDVDEKPVDAVCVDDFYLASHEVTQGQWKTVMQKDPSYFVELEDHFPVENMSWMDVQEFMEKLNKQTGRRYRVPTEAEWEYAAKSGGKKEKYAGTSRENEVDQFAWYERNSQGRTQPVGRKRPNGLGLYDMSGNVFEWCSDWYEKEYYRNNPKNNPKGPSGGTHRVVRGGSWASNGWNVRTANRGHISPPGRRYDIGFRVGFSAR